MHFGPDMCGNLWKATIKCMCVAMALIYIATERRSSIATDLCRAIAVLANFGPARSQASCRMGRTREWRAKTKANEIPSGLSEAHGGNSCESPTRGCTSSGGGSSPSGRCTGKPGFGVLQSSFFSETDDFSFSQGIFESWTLCIDTTRSMFILYALNKFVCCKEFWVAYLKRMEEIRVNRQCEVAQAVAAQRLVDAPGSQNSVSSTQASSVKLMTSPFRKVFLRVTVGLFELVCLFHFKLFFRCFFQKCFD